MTGVCFSHHDSRRRFLDLTWLPSKHFALLVHPLKCATAFWSAAVSAALLAKNSKPSTLQELGKATAGLPSPFSPLPSVDFPVSR
jgi:hypothetical protein